MPLVCPSRSSRAKRALASSWLLPAGVWLLASACGPGVATPMPEPPAATAFDLSGISGATTSTAKQPLDTRVLVIESATGNVPQGATVRVTNLDTMDAVVAGIGNPNGGFEVDLIVTDGQELRFEWVSDAERSAPADAIITRRDPNAQNFSASPAPRFDCLKLSPGFVLDLAGTTHATLGIENGCTSAVQLANPRSRLTLTDFALPGALPASVGVGESAQISVDFTRTTPGIREDVLFIDVTLAGTTIRYPVTLRAE